MASLTQTSQTPTSEVYSQEDFIPQTPEYSPTKAVYYSVNFGPGDSYTLTNYNQVSSNGEHYKSSFEIKNTPVALANALRRTFSSLCPTVTFNDSYESKSIVVNNNTSSLHNEFITHRISLIPINMTDNHNLSFNTKFNEKTSKRMYSFTDSTMIPVFSLNIKNNLKSAGLRDQFGIINVTSNDFEIKLGEDTILDTQHFFKPDVFTGEPILINKLKSNISDENEGEEMNIQCFPRIGLGKQNARHDPTGTVTYEFEIDNEDEVEKVFNHKIQRLQQERLSKKLNTLSETEIDKLHKSFNLLDKQRVYTRNDSGEPNHFKYSVESIGFLNPDQIVIDSVFNLILNLVDLRNSIKFNTDKTPVKLESNSKVEINNLTSKVGEGLSIKIHDENHTAGNLIQHYLRTKYLADTKNPENRLAIASYRMPHPTVEEIEFILVPSKDLNKPEMISEIDNIFNLINSNKHVEHPELKIDGLQEIDNLKLTHMFLTCLFIDAINLTLSDLSDFLVAFKLQSQIENTTYSTEDSDTYINNTNNTRINGKLGN